jgi:hypothetical protein
LISGRQKNGGLEFGGNEDILGGGNRRWDIGKLKVKGGWGQERDILVSRDLVLVGVVDLSIVADPSALLLGNGEGLNLAYLAH